MQGKEKTFRRKKEKATSLLLALTVIVLSLTGFSDWSSIGIHAGGSWVGRLLYPFFHASVVHASLNTWCFICLMFIYDIKLTRVFVAYIVSVSFPIDTLSSFISFPPLPTVGMSGVVFFLFGSISFEVRKKLYYQSWMLFYLIVGFFFPNTNAWLHLYCYLCGVVFSLLNYPITICRKK
ncbi:rhomboid family intramembrane serine protease [Prevotella bivia]|uniref:rhomboid family intramembrane serine protease n=1 Tax=Prevotella bivia TaxID=28125 RepID=UPI00288B5604|nr:rhomboid family intramembrane serine protease [Prevotella bivia]